MTHDFAKIKNYLDAKCIEEKTKGTDTFIFTQIFNLIDNSRKYESFEKKLLKLRNFWASNSAYRFSCGLRYIKIIDELLVYMNRE